MLEFYLKRKGVNAARNSALKNTHQIANASFTPTCACVMRARKYFSNSRTQFEFHCTLLIYSHHACMPVLVNLVHVSLAAAPNFDA